MGAYQSTVNQVLASVERLDAQALQAWLPILDKAQAEVAKDLAAWLAKPGADDKFTAQRYREALVQLRSSLAHVKAGAPAIFHALLGNSLTAGNLALGNLVQEVEKFSLLFTGMAKTLPVAQAAILAEGRRELIPRYKTSAARYTGDVGRDIRAQLAIGVTRGETFDELTNRLVRLGGPKGIVALRGVAGEPGAKTELIAEGLFTRYRHWAERVARTEVMHAYNLHHVKGIEDAADGDPKMGKKWDASLDKRACPICRNLNGQTAKPKENFPGGYPFPPAHPRCRCVVVAWSSDWDDLESPVTGPLDGIEQTEDGYAVKIPEPKPKKPPPEPAPKLHPQAPQAKILITKYGGPTGTESLIKAIDTQPDLTIRRPVAQMAGFADWAQLKEAVKAQLVFAEWAAKNVKAAAKLEAKAAKDKEKADAKAKAVAAKAEEKARALAIKTEEKRLAAEAKRVASGKGNITDKDLAISKQGGLGGQAIALDTDKIEGHAVRIRQHQDQAGNARSEVTFKVTADQEATMRQVFDSSRVPVQFQRFGLQGGILTDLEPARNNNDAGGRHVKVFKTPTGQDYTVEWARDGAMANAVKITVPGGKPADTLAAMQDFGQRTKIDMTKRPDEKDRAKLAENAITTKTNVYRNGYKDPRDQAIIDSVIKDAKAKEVFPGHTALFSDSLAAKLTKEGKPVAGLTHDSSTDMKTAARILTEGGLMASKTRFEAGIFTTGMSTGTDFGTGGADGLFTRVVRDPSKLGTSDGSNIRFVIDPQQLGRLDWWAFNHDNYGRTGKDSWGQRWPLREINDPNQRPNGSNEVMFQKGVPKEAIAHVVVRGREARDELIRELKAGGQTHINGKKIEDFVVVSK